MLSSISQPKEPSSHPPSSTKEGHIHLFHTPPISTITSSAPPLPGANTMDIGRTMMNNFLPRHRLDAGTFGTMGVGLGFAVATALYVKRFDPGARVLCVEGDSAFGFSGMEIETIARYNLPIVLGKFIVR